MVKLEEPNQYVVEVDKEKNRFSICFYGHMKKAKDIPHYVEHVKEAVDMLKPGFLLFVEIAKHSKPPGFQITKLLKESQSIIKKGGNKKTAVFIDPSLLLQRMTLNVVTRLSGLTIKVFKDEKEAKDWVESE